MIPKSGFRFSDQIMRKQERRRSGRERDDVRLEGVARHALIGAQIRVGLGRMRLDTDEPCATAAFGAGRAEIGRAFTEVDGECAHALKLDPFKVFASEISKITLLYHI